MSFKATLKENNHSFKAICKEAYVATGGVIEEAYQRGYAEGQADGYAVGIEQGRADKLREFWEQYQQNGERKNYSYICAEECWIDDYYDPQYPFVMDGTLSNPAYRMYSSSNITDTKQPIIMNEYVIKTGYVFHNARKLKIIRGLTVDEAVVFASHWFQNCVSLEELYMGGTIGTNGFDVHWSTLLNHDSIVSIINCLSSKTTDLTVTLSLIAVNNAFETSEDAADGSASEEWLALVATKENWIVELA